MNYKLRRRFSIISLNTVYNLCTSLYSTLLALLVIRLCSAQLWGNMVEILLWIGIAAHILYWGNKDFLLREFSFEPMNMYEKWQKSIYTRGLLFLLAIIVPFLLPIAVKLKLILLFFLASRFVYQSYDVIILYRKRFITSIVLETVAFVGLTGYIFLSHQAISLNRLVLAFALAEATKAISMFVLFHKEFPLKNIRLHKEYFVSALPFFLLGFTGLFQSKIDLICVIYYLPKWQVAQYQVYMNFLLLVQASSSFILAPFAKNIYRLKKDSILKIAAKLFLVGIACAIIAIPAIDFVIKLCYGFSLPKMALLSGGLFVIPIFYYSPLIYYMLKLNGQRKIVLINLVGIAFAFTLNMILIPYSTNGISGAMDAIAITQWILLILCMITGKITPIMQKSELSGG